MWQRLPEAPEADELLSCAVALSPLALSLQYRFPVHRVGPAFRPAEAGEPTFLVVYRNRADEVKFMQTNAATARLLELVGSGDGVALRPVLAQLAVEMGMDEAAVLAFGVEQVAELAEQSVVVVTGPADGS